MLRTGLRLRVVADAACRGRVQVTVYAWRGRVQVIAAGPVHHDRVCTWQAQFITIVIDEEQKVYQEQLGRTIDLPIENNEDTLELLQVIRR